MRMKRRVMGTLEKMRLSEDVMNALVVEDEEERNWRSWLLLSLLSLLLEVIDDEADIIYCFCN